MIPKFMRLGIVTILKIICEKITIKNIEIVNKNNKLKGVIDELYIKAESIIFNKIYISNINIKLSNLVLKFALNKKKFFINNCSTLLHMRLSKDNINETIFNKNWNRLKTSIESYILMSFQSIEIHNNSIYFISSDKLPNKDIKYTLKYDENSISLVNNINQRRLTLINDKNISVNNLFLYENYIEVELSSKIKFN
tara:strand:+ start:1182 stop:1769 length:588 start_codon:yes stop_codon:yes gene_type:complete